jgi:hypothetical protein
MLFVEPIFFTRAEPEDASGFRTAEYEFNIPQSAIGLHASAHDSTAQDSSWF